VRVPESCKKGLQDGDAQLLESELPYTLWTPAPWLDEVQEWKIGSATYVVFLSRDTSGYKEWKQNHYLGEFLWPSSAIGIDQATGCVVHFWGTGSRVDTAYMNSTLHQFVDSLAGFCSLLPLFTDEELEASVEDLANPDPRPDAVQRVTRMLESVDPSAVEGAWQYYIDFIWYGDLGSESSLLDWKEWGMGP
jgi:hypothetical protein